MKDEAVRRLATAPVAIRRNESRCSEQPPPAVAFDQQQARSLASKHKLAPVELAACRRNSKASPADTKTSAHVKAEAQLLQLTNN